MRIVSIEVVIEHKLNDVPTRVILARSEEKQWTVLENGKDEYRGLYPSEIGLANKIQEEIFGKLNLSEHQ